MSQYRNALFALYDLTIEIEMPYLNILRYIILNILRYCVFIDKYLNILSLALPVMRRFSW